MKLLNKIFNGNKSPSLIEGGASITSRGGYKFAFFYIIPALFITFISTAAVADGTSGYVCDPRQRTYTSCNEGYVMFGGTGPGNSCILCNSGYYTTTENNTTACKSCSIETQGQYPLSDSGSTSIDQCYQTCNNVKYYYYQRNTTPLPASCWSQNWCERINDGNDYIWTTANTCIPCSYGQNGQYYYVNNGKESCESCSGATDGQYPHSDNKSTSVAGCYQNCNSQKYYSNQELPVECYSQNWCNKTDDNKYYVWQNSQCKTCGTNTYYNLNGTTESCVNCPSGYGSNGGSSALHNYDCFMNCPDDSIDGGRKIADSSIVNYPDQCQYNTIVCEIGRWLNTSYDGSCPECTKPSNATATSVGTGTSTSCHWEYTATANYVPTYTNLSTPIGNQDCRDSNYTIVSGQTTLNKDTPITIKYDGTSVIYYHGTTQLSSAPKCVSNVYTITLKNGSATVETICQKYGTCFYDANGTSCAASYSNECPGSSKQSVTPPKSAKVFTGYYTSNGSNPTIQANGQLLNNSMFTSSSVLYAHWGDNIGWTLQLNPSVLTKTDCSGGSCVANSDKGTNNGKLIDSCTSCSNGSFDSQNPKTFTLNSTGINAINDNPPATITATVTLKDCDAGNYCTGLTLYSCNNGNLKSTTEGTGKSSLRDCQYWSSPLTLQDNTASKSISTSGNKFQMSPQTIDHMVSLCDRNATNCD